MGCIQKSLGNRFRELMPLVNVLTHITKKASCGREHRPMMFNRFEMPCGMLK